MEKYPKGGFFVVILGFLLFFSLSSFLFKGPRELRVSPKAEGKIFNLQHLTLNFSFYEV